MNQAMHDTALRIEGGPEVPYPTIVLVHRPVVAPQRPTNEICCLNETTRSRVCEQGHVREMGENPYPTCDMPPGFGCPLNVAFDLVPSVVNDDTGLSLSNCP